MQKDKFSTEKSIDTDVALETWQDLLRKASHVNFEYYQNLGEPMFVDNEVYMLRTHIGIESIPLHSFREGSGYLTAK